MKSRRRAEADLKGVGKKILDRIMHHPAVDPEHPDSPEDSGVKKKWKTGPSGGRYWEDSKGNKHYAGMNRIAKIAEKIAASKQLVEQAIDIMENERFWTDYGAMELQRSREKTRGDRIEFDCTFYFDKILYIGHWILSSFLSENDRAGKEAALEALEEIVKMQKGKFERDIRKKLEKDPPLEKVVGWMKGDDYGDVSVKIDRIVFGKPQMVSRGEVGMPGKVELTLKATKLPDLSEGPYDKMSDRKLREWIGQWAQSAPENFWMDGEYRGSAAARTRQLMQHWRSMTPRQQENHFKDLQSWI